MSALKEIYELCHGIEYSRDIPKEAEKIAKENNIIVIVGGSDDLMYCYGADCYLTKECEHPYGWDGEDFSDISDEYLLNEINQLGLKIWWCGIIGKTFAVFTAVEVKTGRLKPTAQQLNFIDQVRKSGGYAGVAYSVEDAIGIIEGDVNGNKY